MRWTWTPGVVDPTVSTFAGIGCNNVKFDQASRLYIRGGSNGGGPNPVEMWAKLFNSTNDRKGTLELTVPNTAKWIVYEVLGYETLPRPQVQAFKVQVLDRQFEFARGDEVFLSWALAGDRGDAAALAALEQRVAALEALTD
jgi:hypothetical protein